MPRLTKADKAEVAYLNRCRAVAEAMGLVLVGSSCDAGFSASLPGQRSAYGTYEFPHETVLAIEKRLLKRENSVSQWVGEFERVVTFVAAYDHRSKPGGGQHGVNLHLALIGPKGAVSCTIFTNWSLPIPSDDPGMGSIGGNMSYIMEPQFYANPTPSLVCYHRPKRRESYENKSKSCEYLGGRPCYSSGSSIASQLTYDALRSKGLDGVFDQLMEHYVAWMEDE